MGINDSQAEFFGKLGIIVLESSKELGEKINNTLLTRRRSNKDFIHANEFDTDTYIVPVDEIRFANGEGKVQIKESVRGKDIYILCDIGNYSCTYDMYGFKNHMSADDHFQDIKRTLSAIGGKARRTTVIMPLLYASRQHKRKSRESLDCAMALQELENMGIKNILTFDVHDTSVQNAIPLVSFENFYPTYDVVKRIYETDREFLFDRKVTIISPDTGAMDRAIYYASVLGADVGLFYKRRDYSVIVNGKNPIIEHEYLGRPLEGHNVLIVDDMIASGESVFDIAAELKKRKVNKVFVAATFTLFTEGIDMFNDYHERGIIDRVYSTNMTYIPEEVKKSEWYRSVDMSGYMAKLIDHLNYRKSIAPLLDATGEIKKLFQRS